MADKLTLNEDLFEEPIIEFTRGNIVKVLRNKLGYEPDIASTKSRAQSKLGDYTLSFDKQNKTADVYPIKKSDAEFDKIVDALKVFKKKLIPSSEKTDITIYGDDSIEESLNKGIREDVEPEGDDIVFTPDDSLIDNGEVVNTEKPDEQTPETPEDNGVARLILHAINGETDTIAEYNDLIANTDNEDIIRIIQDITAEENNHIGMLQKALELISPNASNIDGGMKEAEGMIDESETTDEPDSAPVEESLTEADTLHQKFKKDIKNQYKSWANEQEKTEQRRKDMMDILNDHPEVSDETRDMWTQKVNDLYPNQEFEYDFPRNLEKIDYPFYVTYYAEYPIYEPAEGGYYYAGNDAIWSEGFNTEEEAWEYADKYVEQDDEWGDWQRFTDGYKLDGKYIGQNQYVVVEPKKSYLGMVKGWEPYQ